MNKKKGAVLIMGAGPGLGSSLAKKFAEAGHHVYISRRARNQDQLEQLAENIKSDGHLASCMPCDAREESEVQKLFNTVNKVCKDNEIENFRIVINNGAEAGQEVFHIHIHILSGRKLNWPPG